MSVRLRTIVQMVEHAPRSQEDLGSIPEGAFLQLPFSCPWHHFQRYSLTANMRVQRQLAVGDAAHAAAAADFWKRGRPQHPCCARLRLRRPRLHRPPVRACQKVAAEGRRGARGGGVCGLGSGGGSIGNSSGSEG